MEQSINSQGAKSAIPSKPFIVSLGLTITILLSLIVTIYLARHKQTLKTQAAGASVAYSFQPSTPQTVNPGGSFNVSVFINPTLDSYQISAASVSAIFNPNLLQLTGISAGPFFKNNLTTNRLMFCRANLQITYPIVDTDPGASCSLTGSVESGVATVILGSPCDKTLETGQTKLNCHPKSAIDSLATFSFTVKPAASGTATIAFNSTGNEAVALGSSANVLDPSSLTATASILIGGGGQTGSLNFLINFQGITAQSPGHPDKVVKVILKQGTTLIGTFPNITTTWNTTQNAYAGTLPNITPGTYDVFIKGPAHLGKKFASVALTAGANDRNWSSTSLKAGDIAGGPDNSPDNKIDVSDLGLLLSVFNPTAPVSQGAVADLDADGKVDVSDLGTLLSNFDPVAIGDQ